MIEKRFFDNTIPYIRIAGGHRILVYLPPLGDALVDVHKGAKSLARQFSRYNQDYTVYVIGRRKNMPQGYSHDDMSQDHQKLIRSIIETEPGCGGKVYLAGCSMGGMCALKLVIDAPELFYKASIQSACHRIPERVRDIGLQWIRMIERGRWFAFHMSCLKHTFFGIYKAIFYTLSIIAAPWTIAKPESPNDLVRSIQANLDFDLSEKLAMVKVPIQFILGERDDFFTMDLVNEAIENIDNASSVCIENAGHAPFIEKKAEFDFAVMQFMAAA